MGRSHALAYHRHPGFEIVGLVNRRTPKLEAELAHYPVRPDYPGAVSYTHLDVYKRQSRERPLGGKEPLQV